VQYPQSPLLTRRQAGQASIGGAHALALAPDAAHNHPTEEHLLPLYVALGAGAEGANHVHSRTTYGILRMDAFAFGGAN
jgi:aromatic ring-opening dioxygenase catalytic subunit (LigB family)